MAAQRIDTPDPAGLLTEWRLRPDGDAVGPTVLPVRTDDGTPAVLKVGASPREHLVLRRWGGHGAVRLLRADPRRAAVLLERAGSHTLESLTDVDACRVVVGLYRQLHVPAMPQLPGAPTFLRRWADDFDGLPRGAPVPHRLVSQAATLARELAEAPADVVVHGDLHFGNVLAATRAAWLAIAPRPVNADPCFEIAPMLWTRWDEIADDVRRGVQRRFYALVDAAGFDEDAARAWVLLRVVRAATQALDGEAAVLTRWVTLAKAVQD
ncbi:aminoglycoside resistance protein [Mycolicibacterium flavescens]|uniref:Aminoglycoside resistance protein n=1 Tax=Mycolicibacterium flavescens TaxID=1776 RepID=A0A1E3RD65_MYCFV|nr:aminoglycoside phosphotransferase family protein [Mycolicibacterium flavescens]MCV7278381.1 aminoglycoside resistance protein [Mycolicibacterium flavescens]ODQ87826.1 aminoglycoside resistance protein [Mycolicibacterium flavescens]